MARASQVHPEAALAPVTEHGAFVQPYFGFVDKKFIQGVTVHSEGGEIQPNQIGAVRLHEFDLGQILFQEAADKCNVSFQVFQQLIQPVLAVSIG